MPRIDIPTAAGSRYRPETTTEAPNPNPVLFGSWANWGNTMNEEYMPAPSRNAARFVVHTPRMRIIVMSTSGLLARTSTVIQTSEIARPTAIRPSARADPQPHVVVSDTAIRTVDMPIVISAADSQLMRPGTRTGDSGLKRQVATAASTVAISGIQNSQW